MRQGAGLILELLWWLVGRRQVFIVTGTSMAPTLSDGDRVFVVPEHGAPTQGAIVVAQHPQRTDTVLIKRVRSVAATTFAVGSDDPTAGTDSRHFGSLPHDHLIGPITGVWRSSRPTRGKGSAR